MTKVKTLHMSHGLYLFSLQYVRESWSRVAHNVYILDDIRRSSLRDMSCHRLDLAASALS